MATQSAASRLVRNVAWLGAVLLAVAIATGYIAVEFSPLWAAAAFAGTIGLGYALVGNDDELSISFALTVVAVGLLIIEFVLPEQFVGAVSSETLTWPPDPVDFAILSGVVIFAWWLIDIRLIQRSGVKPNTVAKRLSSRVQRLVEEWLSIARIAFMLGVLIGVLVLNTFVAPVLGELGSIAGEVPYIVSNIVTLGLGYLALGGDVPFLNGIPVVGEIGSLGFLLLGGVVFLVAVGVDYAD